MSETDSGSEVGPSLHLPKSLRCIGASQISMVISVTENSGSSAPAVRPARRPEGWPPIKSPRAGSIVSRAKVSQEEGLGVVRGQAISRARHRT